MFGGTPQSLDNPALAATSGDLALAQQNQQFWDQWHQTFNPQSPVASTPSSAPAYAGNTQAAMQRADQERSLGPTGSGDATALNRNISNQNTGQSKTEDLNSFLNNMKQNQAGANQKGVSMFNTAQNMNKANEDIYQNLPREGATSGAQEQQKIHSLWQDYYNTQGGAGNEIGGLLGNFGGGILANKLFPSKKGTAPNEGEE